VLSTFEVLKDFEQKLNKPFEVFQK